MIKIVVISDTHNHHNKLDLPDGDILVHAGDFSRGRGSLDQIEEFNEWMGTLKYSHIICIPGNHDFPVERNVTHCRKIMNNCHLLIDEEIVIDGVKFYGSPYQPWFYSWAFNLQRGKELADKWAMIPDDTDVLITHTPPFGINDVNNSGENCGCVDLLNRINEVKPRVSIQGHIHESYGEQEISGVKFINASICDERYNPINKPIIFEYSK